MVVLDTSVVSALMLREPDALERLAEFAPDRVWLTSPVGAEISFGLERLVVGSRRRRILAGAYQRLRDVLEWYDWGEASAAIFGRQKALLESRGQIIGDMDIAIGSIALTLGASVATLNVRHFSRLDGLVVDDWGG